MSLPSLPVKGESPIVAGKPLLEYTIARARASKYLKKIIVSTDNPKTGGAGAQPRGGGPFSARRVIFWSAVDLEQVLQYTLSQLEKNDIWPDVVVSLEITFPFPVIRI